MVRFKPKNRMFFYIRFIKRQIIILPFHQSVKLVKLEVMDHQEIKTDESIFLGNNIKLLRKARKLSQQKLGDFIGIKRNNIATYESGIVEPSTAVFLQLSRFFNIPPRQLLFTDLSKHVRFLEEQNKHNLPDEDSFKDVELMHKLLRRTTDMQIIMEGLKTFYKLKSQDISNASSAGTSVGNEIDLKRSLQILTELTELNWQFIREMQKEN